MSLSRIQFRLAGFVGLTAALLTFSVGLVASSSTFAADTPKRGGKLIIAQDEGPDRLEPHGTSAAFQNVLIVASVYESLLSLDNDFNINPSLASAWVQESATSYLFTLRPGVKFHDGSDLTPEDVVFTFERILDPKRPSTNKLKLRMIKSVTAVDGNKVRIELNNQSASFLRNIAAPDVAGIISKKFTLANNNDLSTVEIGTGPFKITRFQPGVIIQYVRFDDYWVKGQPYLDGIDVRIIPDDSTRIAALRTGEVDMSLFRPDKKVLLNSLRDVVLSDPIANAVEPMISNCTVAPLDKVDVRRAFSLSIDRTALMNTVVPGQARPGLLIPPADKKLAYQGNGSDVPYWTQDIKKAKELLASAGYPNGIELKVQYINTPAFAVNNRIAEVVKQQVAAAGINLILEPVEFSAILSNRAAGKYVLQATGRGTYPDPEGSLTDTLADNPRNWCKDPKVDQMINAAEQELDVAKREKLLTDVQKYIQDQGYWFYLFAYPLRIEVWKNHLKGYDPAPMVRRTSLVKAWLDR